MKKQLALILLLFLILPQVAVSSDFNLDPPGNATHIAVIPFKNLTGDQSLHWLSIGLHDAMTVDLWNIKNFETVPLPAFPYFMKRNLYNPEQQKVMKEAKYEFLHQLWIGEYTGNPENIILKIRVVDVVSGKVLTSVKIESPLDNLLVEASHTVLKIAKAIGVKVDKDEEIKVLSHKTSLIDAWRFNAKGFIYQHEYETVNTFDDEREEKKKELLHRWEASLVQAVETDPQYAEALNNLGWMYVTVGQENKALEIFQRALNIKPYLLDSRFGIGNVFMSQKKTGEGLTYFVDGINLNPSLSRHYDSLWKALWVMGEKDRYLELGFKMIKSPTASLRHEALWWIMSGDKSEVIPLLIEIIKTDSNDRVRYSASYNLVEIGDKRITPFLMEMLNHTNPSIRANAIEGLGHFKEKAAIPKLIKLLNDPSDNVKSMVVKSLEKIGDKIIIPDMIKLLEHPNADLRGRAAIILGGLGDPGAIPFLIKTLKDENNWVRGRAIGALGDIGDTKAVPVLIKILNDPNTQEKVRWITIYALGQLGDSSATPALINVLMQDTSSGNRSTAAYSLGKIEDKSAVSSLIKALGDKAYEVRSNVAEALGNIGEKQAVPSLINALQDTEWLGRSNAAEALGMLGDNRAVPALIEALQDKKDLVRSAAVLALGKIGGRDAVTALIKAMNDPDIHVGCDAAIALGEMGEKIAVPVLIKALNGNYGWKRSEIAADVLAEMGEVTALYDGLLKSGIYTFNRIRWDLLFPDNFDVLTNSPDPLGKTMGYYLMTLKAREAGRYEKQYEYIREIFGNKTGLIDKENEPALYILAYWLKTHAEIKLGKNDDALQTVIEAERLLVYLSHNNRESYRELFEEYTLFMKGEVYTALGKNQKAAKAYQLSLEELGKSKKHYIDNDSIGKLKAMVLTSLGALQIHMGKENLEKAVEGGREYDANDSVEMENEEKRYLELARQKAAEGDYEEAQALIEELNLRRTKYINRRMKLRLADPEKQAQMQEYDKRQEEIEDINRKIREITQNDKEGFKDNTKIKELEKEKNRKKRDLKKYLTKLKKSHPDIAALLGAKPMELSAIQEQLPEDVAVLQYMMLPDKLIVFVLKSDGIEIVETQTEKKEIKKKVRKLRREINALAKGKQSRKIKPLSKELNKILIEPIEEAGYLKDVKVVGIAPNSFLHNLPYGVLMNEGSEYLIDRYNLFYINSTSILGVAMQRGQDRKTDKNTLLAFSNPDGTLKYADKEVDSISKLFEDKQLYSQKEAKKSVIQNKDRDYSILHLSTHGNFNAIDSTKSHLIMADSNLTVEEIWGLPLKGTTLTVLSACETGVGEVMSGDDVVSLENAFIYAGSASVVATLWKVDDEATAELIQMFYQNILKGMTKAEALTEAQKAIKKEYPHPFYWAAITLRGDWR